MARLPSSPPRRPLVRPETSRGELLVLPVGTELVRVYFVAGPHAGGWNLFRAWGPTGSRFDHHEPPPHLDPDRAVLYAGESIATAVAEVFQDTGVIDMTGDSPYLAGFALARELRLLNLASGWPTRAGASQALGTAPDHAACRAWSRAIWEDLADIAGIAWPSAMHYGGRAVALYERARDAIAPDPITNLPLATRGLALPLAHIADKLGYEISEPA